MKNELEQYFSFTIPIMEKSWMQSEERECELSKAHL